MCPSRGRPEPLMGMIESVTRTAPLADVAVYLDQDNRDAYPEDLGRNVKLTVGPRIGPTSSFNMLVRENPGYDAYGAATDDSSFGRPGWDRWVLEKTAEFGARIGAMSPYVPDSERMDFPWVTREWINALGYFAYAGCHHFCWDVCVEILGQSSQIAYAGPADFMMHHHEEPHIGDSNTMLLGDCKQFFMWSLKERPFQTAKLRRLCGLPPLVPDAPTWLKSP